MNRLAEFIIFGALVATVAFLAVVVWNMKDQIAQLSKQKQAQVQYITQPGQSPAPSSPVNTNQQDLAALREYFDTALSTISGTKETIIKETKEVVNTSGSQTSYIPMGSTATTTSTDWVDVADSKVYIDLINDYAENAYVTWEASLKVAHDNGKAFARLFDETNGIAVSGSEITVENNSSFVQKSSGYLPLWRGRNLYKVQIKSLNSFEVTYSSGKIKIKH